jgi:hypothetical protein
MLLVAYDGNIHKIMFVAFVLYKKNRENKYKELQFKNLIASSIFLKDKNVHLVFWIFAGIFNDTSK